MEETNNEIFITENSEDFTSQTSTSTEEELVKIYNEKPDSSMTVDPNYFITTLSVSVTDIQSKFKVFMDTYWSTMIEYKKANPEKWKELVENLKEQYKSQPTNMDNVIELLAALSLEYGTAIQQDTFKSEFVQALRTFNSSKS